MGEKHSAVGYLFREGAFLPAQETKPVHNEFGLDLFQHRGSVYEGKTGLQFCSLQQAEDLAGFVEKHGGIEKVQKLIADSLERTGLSPRYTRPDEKKKDIFPPKEKDENRVFAKDLMGNKHYYYRFYNENGIELYTMEKKREFFQTVYIPCDGFMVGIDQRHRLEEVLKWLPTLEHGIRGEIERVFNQSMEAPDRWADLGFANLLGRYEEAKAHNAPIAAERQRQADERRAQQDAREQQLAQERQARYDSAIREAEGNIMAGKEVINREINGKSLIMQESDALCNTSRSALCCSAVFTHHDTRLTRQRKSSLYGSMVAGSIVLKAKSLHLPKDAFSADFLINDLERSNLY